MELDRFSIALVFLVPQILELVMKEYAVNDEKAAEMFYSSELYSVLEDEKTKLWHLSAHTLFEMFLEELKTGTITFPEEA